MRDINSDIKHEVKFSERVNLAPFTSNSVYTIETLAGDIIINASIVDCLEHDLLTINLTTDKNYRKVSFGDGFDNNDSFEMLSDSKARVQFMFTENSFLLTRKEFPL